MPEKISKIKNPPPKLYCLGNLELLKEDSFAIVGTRKITDDGIKSCEKFSKELALRNITIVSGMATGTDTVAHKSALVYGGKTIAVLPSGLQKIFPVENRELFKNIIEKDGLIITEYENDILASKEKFLQRNRLIAAVSLGVLVIEASFRSGTSITARYAKEQGKKVFAIPGNLNSSVGVGVNNLIKSGEAVFTTSIEDILKNYPQFMNKKRKDEKNKLIIKNEYLKIYNILKEGEHNLETLIEKTKYDIVKIIKILIEMENEKIIVHEMGIYSINEKGVHSGKK